ncbi:MAG TPA: LytTR family DNA-binding domain-containing protein [Verrucomicrobiae bacterium]|jgi:two-component system LytT family response regulator
MPADPAIRVLLVDDEAPARTRLRQMLAGEKDFSIIGECANGRQAVAAIQKDKPDVVFLDVQMPRLNGFEVCAQIGVEALPPVVFVTAYDQYALQAFEVHALDYLLKPFDKERFRRTLRHLRARVRNGSGAAADPQLLALLEQLRSGARAAERLVFKVDGRIIFVRPADIEWLEADGNYVHVHTVGTKHLVRDTLTALEGQLPAGRFLRISRSAVVNLDRVKELQSLFYGDYAVILRDGTRLNMSRTYRDGVEKLLARPR